MKIKDLFQQSVTRDIPPVVYFHQQSPDKLAHEVSEYIFTGGFLDDHPGRQRVPVGIHDHYVQLLTAIADRLERDGGPGDPASWISGFYGSGKSSFAKLLGLSLDGKTLPGGTHLADAWLRQDTTQRAHELHAAYKRLLALVDPMAVVFDIGGISRGDEHIHSAVVRQVQERLGYCAKEPIVADYELKLQRDGRYDDFVAKSQEVLGEPWDEVKTTHMVEDHFSLVLHHMFPEHYRDPMDWLSSRDGKAQTPLSAEDAALAIHDMLRFRAPDKTLFVVIDEVSQYIFHDDDRMLAVQSLVKALEQRLEGRAWLLATGQQQLDEQNDESVLGKMKDRFPPDLRVHLASTNIRDVVHKRLLEKKPEAEKLLATLYDETVNNLRLFGYDCEQITKEDFIEVYPMLPQHIDLILQITSVLRSRSTRTQGDDYAIRGLLQMLGELFRTQGVADMPMGRLITLDLIYEVQSSALNQDVQNTMARVLDYCARHRTPLLARCAKAVALLELLQREEGGVPTTNELVARCLYDDVRAGDNRPAITEALEQLRRDNLLGYSENNGYKIQSSAGQEWERERRDITVSSDEKHDLVLESLDLLVGDTSRPTLKGRGFAWFGLFSTEHSHQERPLRTVREDGPIVVDFRFVPMEIQDPAAWVNRSTESGYAGRIICVAGQYGAVVDAARSYAKSRHMVRRYKTKSHVPDGDKRRLLHEEEAREEDLREALQRCVADAYMSGRVYFEGQDDDPTDYGASFKTALTGIGNARLPSIYRHFDPTTVTPGELKQLTVTPLSGPDAKFFQKGLGILDEDAGRIVSSCNGPIPSRVYELIQREQGVSGATLLKRFSDAPYGHAANVIKACVAGLLHASKVRLIPASEEEITSVADKGVQSLFDADRAFKATNIFPAGEARIKPQDRAKICEMFKAVFQRKVEPTNEAIADAIFPVIAPTTQKLRDVERALNRLPGRPEAPKEIQRLNAAFEDCLRKRQVEPAVLAVRKNLQVLNEGVGLLNAYHSELTDEAIESVQTAHEVVSVQQHQLYQVGAVSPELSDAESRIADQLKRTRPWSDVSGLDADVDAIRRAYAHERQRRIARQQEFAYEADERVKALRGFATLNPDEQYNVLRPVRQCLTETTEGAVAPTLQQLLDGIELRFEAAVASAGDRLAELREKQSGEVVVKVTIEVRNREIRDEKDVQALLDEIRSRLMQQLEKGHKVRLRLS